MPFSPKEPAERPPRADGAPPELAVVYREHVAFAWRVVRRMGVPADAVQDVVQDVFLVVRRRLPDYDGRASVKTWIAGICRGVVSNYHRHVKRREARLQLVSSTASASSEPGVERLDTGRMLAEALDRLHEEQRLAIVLTDIEGLTPSDVAQVMGISRNTVYSRLRLARKKLQMLLRAGDAEAEEMAT